jgi:4-diphosphocytidyl-2-C-methyl-D-erythritol kinase
MSLVEHAAAKINLGLHVLRQRQDGYHDVETVLHRIDWADTIIAEPAENLSMTCPDPALPTDEENLCLQAAHQLRKSFGVTGGARLHLEKRVPYGAGLGGGSSDAAATLRLLTRLWELEVRPEQLHDVAAQLGADVPFFLYDAPAAYATDRGDELTPLRDDGTPYRLPFPILVVVPSLEISTPEAYGHVSPHDRSRPHLPSVVRSNALARWRSALTNDFEAPMSEVYPPVDTARQWLWASGAGYVSLSGSGAAVYGVFESTERAEAALAEGEERDERMHLVRGGQEAGSAGL